MLDVCQDLTPDDCTAAGGVNIGPGTCQPGDCVVTTTTTTTTTTAPTTTTTTTAPTTTSTTTTSTSTTTTTTAPLCGNGVVDPGEDCDPVGSLTCPDPNSPSGAFVACEAGCQCPEATTTTTTAAPTTTTTAAPTTTTTAAPTTTTTTTSTTTTTTVPLPSFLDFTTSAPDLSTCQSGQSEDALGTTLKVLHCGGLNIGGGPSTVAEGGTPENATSRFAITGCTGTVCDLGPTLAAGAGFECTNTGCFFGPPLPISSAGTSTCVINTWSAPASGTVDTATGDSSTSVPLDSHVFLTGNGTAPCPRCVGGTCDRGPNLGDPCTTTNSFQTTHDCASDGTDLGSIAVDLTPLVTGLAQKDSATGLFCPGQDMPTNPNSGSKAGCFGSTTCTHIEETGIAAGPLTPGVPATTRLASVFCIPETPGGLGQLINLAAGLPGPGATSLPGTVTLVP